MAGTEWAIWAVLLLAQQFTFLFSGRAKNSGSLRYSALAGIGSHSTWFFSQVFFVQTIMAFKDAPLRHQVAVALFYVTFTILGTLSAQWMALKWETGKMEVGAR